MLAGYMSSVAPNWDLPTLLEQARAYDFNTVEPRVEWRHEHGLERGNAAAWREAQRRFSDAGLVPSSVALGSRFNRATAEERTATVEEVAAYAELAALLGAPVLRVFGGPMPQGRSMPEARPLVAEGLARAAERCAPFGVTPCLETHDDFWNPSDVAWCVEQAGHANLGAVWHAAHHVRRGISVDDAFGILGRWVRHVHLSEIPRPDGAQREGDYPIPLGEGDGSMRRQAELLVGQGYQGALSLEWIPRREANVDPRPTLQQYGATLAQWRRELSE